MKKYLISNDGNFYKANLHCHTNLSDGNFSPEQIKEFYKNLGYSVVAYTDHDVFIPHNDLTDDTFLALNGFEMEFADFYDCYLNAKPWDFVKQSHFCFIALDDKMDIQPFYHRTKYTVGNTQSRKLVKFNENEPDFERCYTPNCINYVIKTAKEKNFFVTYNHPTWSLEDYNDYSCYKNMNAFEIMNGDIVKGYLDYNPAVYDDILRGGQKVYCIGADDNHEIKDMGVCYIMIKAKELTYKAITDSMLSGNFYTSQGPEIKELYIEDDKLYIKCSNAYKIHVTYQACKAQVRYSEDGSPLTEACFDFIKDRGYFRITVTDAEGKHACTNAYFPEDLDL